MTNTLLGIFSNRLHAEEAITDLQTQGFDPKDISIIMKDKAEGEKFAANTGTNLAEGAVSGIATGSLIGGLAGLLVGIGVISVPGIGAILIGGPIAAALGLTGAAATTVSGAVTGALAGGLVGALVGLGIPEKEARMIESKIREGGILVAVPVLLGEEIKVRQILLRHNADMVRLVSSSREEMVYRQTEPVTHEEPRYQDVAYYSQVSPKTKVEMEEVEKPSLKERIKRLFR